jgi:hypothetical protein
MLRTKTKIRPGWPLLDRCPGRTRVPLSRGFGSDAGHMTGEQCIPYGVGYPTPADFSPPPVYGPATRPTRTGRRGSYLRRSAWSYRTPRQPTRRAGRGTRRPNREAAVGVLEKRRAGWEREKKTPHRLPGPNARKEHTRVADYPAADPRRPGIS